MIVIHEKVNLVTSFASLSLKILLALTAAASGGSRSTATCVFVLVDVRRLTERR